MSYSVVQKSMSWQFHAQLESGDVAVSPIFQVVIISFGKLYIYSMIQESTFDAY